MEKQITIANELTFVATDGTGTELEVIDVAQNESEIKLVVVMEEKGIEGFEFSCYDEEGNEVSITDLNENGLDVTLTVETGWSDLTVLVRDSEHNEYEVVDIQDDGDHTVTATIVQPNVIDLIDAINVTVMGCEFDDCKLSTSGYDTPQVEVDAVDFMNLIGADDLVSVGDSEGNRVEALVEWDRPNNKVAVTVEGSTTPSDADLAQLYTLRALAATVTSAFGENMTEEFVNKLTTATQWADTLLANHNPTPTTTEETETTTERDRAALEVTGFTEGQQVRIYGEPIGCSTVISEDLWERMANTTARVVGSNLKISGIRVRCDGDTEDSHPVRGKVWYFDAANLAPAYVVS